MGAFKIYEFAKVRETDSNTVSRRRVGGRVGGADAVAVVVLAVIVVVMVMVVVLTILEGVAKESLVVHVPAVVVIFAAAVEVEQK